MLARSNDFDKTSKLWRTYRVEKVQKLANEEATGVKVVSVNSGDYEIFDELSFSLTSPNVVWNWSVEIPNEMTHSTSLPESPELTGRVEQNCLECQDEAYLLHDTERPRDI